MNEQNPQNEKGKEPKPSPPSYGEADALKALWIRQGENVQEQISPEQKGQKEPKPSPPSSVEADALKALRIR